MVGGLGLCFCSQEHAIKNRFKQIGMKFIDILDGKRLSGEWWFGKQKDKVEHVGYRRILDDMPSWLSERDFTVIMFVDQLVSANCGQ